jgi:hypothetical protein
MTEVLHPDPRGSVIRNELIFVWRHAGVPDSGQSGRKAWAMVRAVADRRYRHTRDPPIWALCRRVVASNRLGT